MNPQHRINKRASKIRRAARQLAEKKVEMDRREYQQKHELKDKEI